MNNAKKKRKTTEWERQNWKYQGNLSYKDRHNKDKNGKNLTEAEEIKKWWQEYTEELTQKALHDPDNHNCVVTHLEPDILENWTWNNGLVQNWERSISRLYCHPAYLIYMQSKNIM